jgi:hypothetical protein
MHVKHPMDHCIQFHGEIDSLANSSCHGKTFHTFFVMKQSKCTTDVSSFHNDFGVLTTPSFKK